MCLPLTCLSQKTRKKELTFIVNWLFHNKASFFNTMTPLTHYLYTYLLQGHKIVFDNFFSLGSCTIHKPIAYVKYTMQLKLKKKFD